MALWQGLIAVAGRDWRGALELFRQGQRALDAYPVRQQARFLLAAARAGLETGVLDQTARNMEVLKGVVLDQRSEAERALLERRLTEVRTR